jgi:ribosomal subunit interface protein
MDLRVIDGPLPTSDTLVAHATHKVRRAMDRLALRVGWVDVRLFDDNSPTKRAGRQLDKRCAIQVALAGGQGPVHVESNAADFYAAVDGAVAKLKKLVSKKADRRKR